MTLFGAACAATAFVFQRAVFSSDIFISRDILRVYYPFKKYWAERVSQGEFPDWYPYDGLGQPFPGIVISGVFHPSNLLYLALPLEVALKLNVLLCFPIALLGTYVFARRIGCSEIAAATAAVIFGFNGYMVGITNNLLYLQAAATFPWAFCAADAYARRPSILRCLSLAVILSLVLFAGDSQSFAVCAALSAVVVLLRAETGRRVRTFALWVGSMVLTAGVAAVQLVPAFHVLSQGKPGAQPLDVALIWSMHPLRLIEFVMGPLFGGKSGSDASFKIARELLSADMNTLWVESVHVGVPGLALAIVSVVAHRRIWQSWVVVGVAALLFLMILGKHAGLYALVFEALPVWRPFRYPEKLLPYLCFLIAVGVCIGLQHCLENEKYRTTSAAVLGALGLLSLLIALQESLVGGFGRHFIPALWEKAPELVRERLQDGLSRGGLYSGTVCLAVAALIFYSGEGRTRLGAMVPLVLMVHLFVANSLYYEVSFPDIIREPPPFAVEVAQREGGVPFGRARVASYFDEYSVPKLEGVSHTDAYSWYVVSGLEPVTSAIWGIESGNGYLPGVTQRVHSLMSQGRLWFLRYSGMFNIRYIAFRSGFFEELGGRRDVVVAEQIPLELLMIRNPTARPRTYLVEPKCAPQEDVPGFMKTNAFDPNREALIKCANGEAPPQQSTDGANEGKVEIISYLPERIELDAQTTTPALLVVNDAYYPGWQATISGRKAEVIPANHAVRGVLIPEGKHRVVLTYRTPGLVAAAWVTGTALLAPLLLGLWLAKKRHR